MTVTEGRANCYSQRRSDSSRSIPSRDLSPRGYLHESCLSIVRIHRSWPSQNTDAGGGGRTRTEVALPRILSPLGLTIATRNH